MAEYIIDAATATHVLLQAQSKWDFAPLIIIDMTESGKDGERWSKGARKPQSNCLYPKMKS